MLDPTKSALVLIDLQKGIVAQPTHPRSGEAVVVASGALAERFRAAGSAVFLVNVNFGPGDALRPTQQVDQPMVLPPGGLPPEWSQLVDGLAAEGDIRITKHQWGAFHGTGLDMQLRRRGIDTIVLGGISTNAGVESTARQAWEQGYSLLVAEDLCASSISEVMHKMAVETIFPRISRVVNSADIAFQV
jgi:nicotinamidase-related amidase